MKKLALTVTAAVLCFVASGCQGELYDECIEDDECADGLKCEFTPLIETPVCTLDCSASVFDSDPFFPPEGGDCIDDDACGSGCCYTYATVEVDADQYLANGVCSPP